MKIINKNKNKIPTLTNNSNIIGDKRKNENFFLTGERMRSLYFLTTLHG
jgi:hypothetical protein